jgi:hypothetical protein
MTISASETMPPLATSVAASDDALSVDLSDGRGISVPLAWFPRLLHATAAERENWRLIARGEGVHWPDPDDDISVTSLLAGRPSEESPKSLQRWLDARKA